MTNYIFYGLKCANIVAGMTNTILARSDRHSAMTDIDPRPNVIHTGRNGNDVAFLVSKKYAKVIAKSVAGYQMNRPYPISSSAALRYPRTYSEVQADVSTLFKLSYLKYLNLKANRYESQEDVLWAENNEIYFF
jgi:hypothetical protein